MDLGQWVWWQWAIFIVVIYLFLGLYGALMHFEEVSDKDKFWALAVLWVFVLYFDQIQDEIAPYYRKCKQERIARRLRRRHDAYEKKYGVKLIK